MRLNKKNYLFAVNKYWLQDKISIKNPSLWGKISKLFLMNCDINSISKNEQIKRLISPFICFLITRRVFVTANL